MVYCAVKLIENLNDSVLLKLFYKSNRPQFLWVNGVITHLGCWENTREACISLAFGSVIYKLFWSCPNIPRGLSRL